MQQHEYALASDRLGKVPRFKVLATGPAWPAAAYRIPLLRSIQYAKYPNTRCSSARLAGQLLGRETEREWESERSNIARGRFSQNRGPRIHWLRRLRTTFVHWTHNHVSVPRDAQNKIRILFRLSPPRQKAQK